MSTNALQQYKVLALSCDDSLVEQASALEKFLNENSQYKIADTINTQGKPEHNISGFVSSSDYLKKPVAGRLVVLELREGEVRKRKPRHVPA